MRFLNLFDAFSPNHPVTKKSNRALLNCMANGREQGPLWTSTQIPASMNSLSPFSHNYIVEKKFSPIYRREEKFVWSSTIFRNHVAVSLGDCTELCHFSPTHFMNFFKKQLGSLVWVHHPISAKSRPSSSILIWQLLISLANLFQQPSNFNRQFKKYYQPTPSQ